MLTRQNGSRSTTRRDRALVMPVHVAGAAVVEAFEWLTRGLLAVATHVLGRGRPARPEPAAPPIHADGAQDRPGWPAAEEVEAALQDLRQQAA